MPRTVIFHQDGSLLLDKHEAISPTNWNTDSFVWFDGIGFKPGWYSTPIGSGRGGTSTVSVLDPDEVPKEIRVKLLLIL